MGRSKGLAVFSRSGQARRNGSSSKDLPGKSVLRNAFRKFAIKSPRSVKTDIVRREIGSSQQRNNTLLLGSSGSGKTAAVKGGLMTNDDLRWCPQRLLYLRNIVHYIDEFMLVGLTTVLTSTNGTSFGSKELIRTIDELRGQCNNIDRRLQELAFENTSRVTQAMFLS